MIHQSLQSLAALPPTTRVYCAHEYTMANLGFASAVEPDNSALQQRIAEAEATRAQNQPTVPSEMALELATNPFLRCADSGLRTSLASQGKLADNEKTIRIRAFYNGVVQLELSGRVEAQAYDPAHVNERSYFTMEQPVVRGLKLHTNTELKILEDLGYAIVRKDRMAYVYDCVALGISTYA